MAIRDHTVRIRSSVPPDDTFALPLGDPSRTHAAEPETLRLPTLRTRGDIALAVLALTRLRVDSEQCRNAQAARIPRQAAAMAASGGRRGQLGDGHPLSSVGRPPAQ